MNSTIHRRIEAIQRGETPKGYKKSQWGTIPSNWEEVRLGDVIIEYKQVSTVNNQYPVLTSSRKGLMLQTDYFNNRQVTTDNNIGYNIIPRGYITFRSRTDDGRFVFNTNNLIDYGIISYFYPVFSFNSTVNSAFLVTLLNYSIYNRFRPFVEGTAQQVLSLRKLGNLIYPLPPLPEQEAIGEILTQQDRLIDLKQRLIDEKRRQKKYLMQTLLTGKTRLPGFKDKWKTKTLGEIATFCSGGTPNRDRSDYFGGTIPWIKSGELNRDIITETEESITDLGLSNSSAKIIPAGTILIAMYGATAGVVAITNISAAINQAILAVKPTIPISICFLYNSIKNIMITAVNKYTQGGQPNFNSAIIKKLSISLPPLPEQEAIAEVLSTADEELSLLERELEQEKLRKKALMQLLLTGLVRVEEL